MRAHIVRLLLAAAATTIVPLEIAFAESARPCDTTKSATEQRTLASSFRVAALHVDVGGAGAIASDSSAGAGEGKIAIAFCRWPEWTIALASGGQSIRRTDYVVPGSNGYHPFLYVELNGIALERRWSEASMIHPVATVGLGTVTGEYRYSHYSHGEATNLTAGHSSTGYYTASAGAELNITRWMRMDALIGERYTGALDTPGVPSSTARGPFLALHVGFGKY